MGYADQKTQVSAEQPLHSSIWLFIDRYKKMNGASSPEPFNLLEKAPSIGKHSQFRPIQPKFILVRQLLISSRGVLPTPPRQAAFILGLQ